MQEATITNEQKVNAHLNPKTATGKPAQVEAGSVHWTIQSGDSTVEPSEDGMTCFLVSSDTPGDTQVLVEADADLGEGVITISDIISLHVTGAQAENLGLSLDEPVAK